MPGKSKQGDRKTWNREGGRNRRARFASDFSLLLPHSQYF
ncbi:hypothetical protein CCACVL1_05106 [Corchorus capsularis]|uniref:Uncharacterized protein n=1 Tax=Corchorus capsularis TaxID=210143 RepID=A0A1R3JMG7_COCAP|nr:hypothetical protein CCACVL1_05106 [Corchorus capsularis]